MSSIDFLMQLQNADGGWGYRINGMSYVEPTAAVVVALTPFAANEAGRGVQLLLSLQHSGGGWGISAMDSESGWMTAWAVRALAGFSDTKDAVLQGVNWLVATEGLRVTDPVDRSEISNMFKIDSTLRGWPWQRGDAAWVHPTALAMLALGHARGALASWDDPNLVKSETRINEGGQYLLDRAVPGGGWNIGNPWMLDKQIPATIQDTAVALLALRAVEQPATEPHIASAIQFLSDAVARAQTPAELAWGIYALKSWSIDTSDMLTRLNTLQKTNGSWNDNPFITAIAVLANKT